MSNLKQTNGCKVSGWWPEGLSQGFHLSLFAIYMKFPREKRLLLIA